MSFQRPAFIAATLAATLFATAVSAAPVAAPAKKPTPFPSAASASQAIELVEDLEGGARINWTAGRMSVSGVGTPGDRGAMSYRRTLAARAARADAYRRLAAALELVRVDSSSRVKDLAVIDDGLRTKLNDYVKAAKLLETNYWPDGSAELVLGVDVKGERSLASLIGAPNGSSPAPAPNTKPAGGNPVGGGAGVAIAEAPAAASEGTEVTTPKAAATPTPRPDGKEIVTEPVNVRGTYSSLIIDGKGLGAQPALIPVIRDKDGKAIELGAGAIKYFRDGAELDPSAGFNPMRLRGMRVQGTLRADLVLPPDAAERLKTALRDKKMAPGFALLIVL